MKQELIATQTRHWFPSHFRGVKGFLIFFPMEESASLFLHISVFKACNKSPLFYFEEPYNHKDQKCCSAPVCRSLKSPKASGDSPCFPSFLTKCTQILGSESKPGGPSKPPHIQQLLSALSRLRVRNAATSTAAALPWRLRGRTELDGDVLTDCCWRRPTPPPLPSHTHRRAVALNCNLYS